MRVIPQSRHLSKVEDIRLNELNSTFDVAAIWERLVFTFIEKYHRWR